MENIKVLLNTIPIPNEGLSLRKTGLFYWGKSSSGDVVYGFKAKNVNLNSLVQSTKFLKICLNKEYVISVENETRLENLSLLMLKQDGIEFLDIFIRLTVTIDNILSDSELLSYFLNLKDLFSNEGKKSVKELQGLYGELFSMVYLSQKHNINISQFYQSEDKRKFDFSVSDIKKIEIKTTTLPTRIHHFKLDQLNVLRYDVMIVSIMFQKDDAGLSLFELIQEAKRLYFSNLNLMIHIENMIKNVEVEVLEMIKYNKMYSENNIRFITANNIPRIQEKTMDGVFNVEFDSDLNSVAGIDPDYLNEWIGTY